MCGGRECEGVGVGGVRLSVRVWSVGACRCVKC